MYFQGIFGMKINRTILSVLVILLTLSCVEEPEKVSITALPLKWRESALPLTVKVHADFSSLNAIDGSSDDLPLAAADDGLYDDYDLMQEMQKAWNDADDAREYFVLDHGQAAGADPYTDLDDYYDGEIGIYVTENWFSSIGYGVLAITSYFAEQRTDHLRMVHGDIIVNFRDYYFSFDKARTQESTTYYDLPSVILHELGHLLGLKHTTSSTVQSIMYPQLGSTEVKRTLGYYDSLSISNLYDTNTQALKTAQAFSSASVDESMKNADDGQEKPKLIHGYIELRADGHCRHFQDGSLIHDHKVF